ncbi:hypothetical protein [Paenibacillus radicis (ex Gao et al. 2016)]|uniref:Uncharacterized protein n=1 Tax=Paenibacillus radicis (ex Gao et al. 2016) TaxID=1737354 RepID=A0A917GZB5_9BACL|nr:hypothetical protein [Paenibacillus radicis (ex Gao et al. 2016)]GGG61494.1 hypothetical protein GCM10010918_13750 [Paenibacillus radicis (ex Gao et al. 2016)]
MQKNLQNHEESGSEGFFIAHITQKVGAIFFGNCFWDGLFVVEFGVVLPDIMYHSDLEAAVLNGIA